MFCHSGQYLSGIIQPPTSFESENREALPSFIDYALPNIIVWNPIMEFQSLLCNDCLKCTQCNKMLSVGYWNDGMTRHTQPRLLHDVDDVVLLVTAVYVCEEKHKILGHDERILSMLADQITLPFILLHQTGFTMRFVEMCQSLCQAGMNFHSLEGVIGNMRWKKFEEKTQMFRQFADAHRRLHACEERQCVIPSFETSMFYKFLPSDDLISKCFVSKFMQDEQYYRREIMSTDTGEELSFDHTFKVAANIGYLRQDNKWVCQYDSVFLVFNSLGNIVSWQFTKSTGFDRVKTLLEHIHRRSQSQNHSIKVIYIDNCCLWRAKIQAIFGDQIKVLLDVFHAFQRVSKTIPKRHPFHAACLQDLRLVFRLPGDYGDKRTKPTPKPDELLNNLDKFSNKWCDVTFHGHKIFTDSTKLEIEKLKVHARKGCLSDIAVGGGTNRNEAFHRYVNTFFHKSRIGILLSYCLMMTIVHQYNTRNRDSRKSIFKPLKKFEPNGTSDEPIGIVNSGQAILHDQSWHQEQSDNETIDTSTIFDILQASLSQLSICRTLKSKADTASSLWKYIPYSQMLPSSLSLTQSHDSDIASQKSKTSNHYEILEFCFTSSIRRWELLFHISSHCFSEWWQGVTECDFIPRIDNVSTNYSSRLKITSSYSPRVARHLQT